MPSKKLAISARLRIVPRADASRALTRLVISAIAAGRMSLAGHVQGLILGMVQADEHPHVARRATSRVDCSFGALGRPGSSRLAEPLASTAQVTYSMNPAKHGPARLVSVSR